MVPDEQPLTHEQMFDPAWRLASMMEIGLAVGVATMSPKALEKLDDLIAAAEARLSKAEK